jgi:hypothetical protein
MPVTYGTMPHDHKEKVGTFPAFIKFWVLCSLFDFIFCILGGESYVDVGE